MVSPEGGIFFDKGDSDLNTVKNAARGQITSSSQPFYKSNGEETRIYDGFFKAASNNTQLAVLSDDGTSVWIDDELILNRTEPTPQPQAFENFDAAFAALPKTFVANRVYHLRLKYTNVIHTGNTDMDGLTLFAYGGGGTVVRPQLELQTNRSDICAGGWDPAYDRGAGGYFYLSKERADAGDPNPWLAHAALPDPHIAVLTARLRSGDGPEIYGGLSVRFRWTMPGGRDGNGLEETQTVRVEPNGTATLKVVSGDAVSQAPVRVTAQVVDTVETTAIAGIGSQGMNLNVKAAQALWQYKDPKENPRNNVYRTLDDNAGSLYDLFADPAKADALELRVLLSFQRQPVFGHHVDWEVARVFDKAGEQISASEKASYGQLSGPVSTTSRGGGATATFTFGSAYFGSILFKMTDGSVLVPERAADAPVEAAFPRLRKRPSLFCQSPTPRPTPTPTPTPTPYSAGPQRYNQYWSRSEATHIYSWLNNLRRYTNFNANAWQPYLSDPNKKGFYPAPAGEENDEMLPETWTGIRAVMTGLGLRENADWWFSQAVGDDPLSYRTHFVDGYFTRRRVGRPGKHPYSAAVDIVLAKIGPYRDTNDPPRIVYKNMKRDTAAAPLKTIRETTFRPIVTALRANGFVAWHRWVGLTPQYVENEIHIIDPAAPDAIDTDPSSGVRYRSLKKSLRDQIGAYIKRLPNGANGWTFGVPGSSGLPRNSPADKADIAFLRVTQPDAQAYYRRKLMRNAIIAKYTIEGAEEVE